MGTPPFFFGLSGSAEQKKNKVFKLSYITHRIRMYAIYGNTSGIFMVNGKPYMAYIRILWVSMQKSLQQSLFCHRDASPATVDQGYLAGAHGCAGDHHGGRGRGPPGCRLPQRPGLRCLGRTWEGPGRELDMADIGPATLRV